MNHGLNRKILFDARIGTGINPGIQSMIEGFALGLNKSQPENTKIYWLTSNDNGWLLKYVSAGQEVLVDTPQHLHNMTTDVSTPSNDSRFDSNYPLVQVDERLPREPKCLQAIKPNIVQFFSQDAFVTSYPTIYHPHDLQHLYLPAFFSVEEIGWRNLAWPKFAGLASKVVVGSQHSALDVEKYWGIPNQKIEKIDLCTTLESSIPSEKQVKDSFPKVFFGKGYIIYPASYHLHKNHIRLLKAISLLKSQGLIVNVVFTGGKILSYNHVDNAIRDLELQDQVLELGFVSKAQLSNLVINSICVVVPSLFESKSFPIVEAMGLGVPVIASDIPGIREQSINVNCLFNPGSEFEIADSIKRIIRLDKLDRHRIIEQNLTLSNQRDWTDVISDYAKLWYRIIEGARQ